ncbi:hypothetical protein BDY24DRAFT_392476 [Mrakia frigida]|uniref:MAPEG family protein n=1 Tax=Mrakia frigida TaxID=29902 RepID=UPI003FCC044D
MSTRKKPSSLIDIPPSQTWIVALLPPLYLSGIPLALYLTKEGSPFVSKVLEPFLRILSSIGPETVNGLKGNEGREVILLSVFFVFVTWMLSAWLSLLGQSLGPAGYKNHAPRETKSLLQGLPGRLCSTHQALIEILPAYAVLLALTLSLAPTNAQAIHLLTLHVFLKTIVYIPSYVLDFDWGRSSAHILAVGSLVGCGWVLVQ